MNIRGLTIDQAMKVVERKYNARLAKSLDELQAMLEERGVDYFACLEILGDARISATLWKTEALAEIRATLEAEAAH